MSELAELAEKARIAADSLVAARHALVEAARARSGAEETGTEAA